MPFRYDKHYETEEELEENYYNEGHYRFPPGFESPGLALRRQEARDRKRRLQELEMQERMRSWYMDFHVDMNDLNQIEFTIKLLQERAQELKNNPIIVPY